VSALTTPRLPDYGPAGAAVPEPDFVKFWIAGAAVIGTFCCAACGRTVRSVRQLPDCPSCSGWVWEQPASSPFAPDEGQHALAEEAWLEDVHSVAGLFRGMGFALLLAPLFWLAPMLALYVLIFR
jgi:hypothetical protein